MPNYVKTKQIEEYLSKIVEVEKRCDALEKRVLYLENYLKARQENRRKRRANALKHFEGE